MKKTLYLLFFALLGIISFAACSDDKDSEKSFEQSAAQAASGIYEGTFSYTSDTGLNMSGSGTLTVTAQSDYVAMFDFSCSTIGINHGSIANICHSNDGFAFSNNLKTNGFGNAFLGRIDDLQNVESHMKLIIDNGNSKNTYNVVFVGHKRQ